MLVSTLLAVTVVPIMALGQQIVPNGPCPPGGGNFCADTFSNIILRCSSPNGTNGTLIAGNCNDNVCALFCWVDVCSSLVLRLLVSRRTLFVVIQLRIMQNVFSLLILLSSRFLRLQLRVFLLVHLLLWIVLWLLQLLQSLFLLSLIRALLVRQRLVLFLLMLVVVDKFLFLDWVGFVELWWSWVDCFCRMISWRRYFSRFNVSWNSFQSL